MNLQDEMLKQSFKRILPVLAGDGRGRVGDVDPVHVEADGGPGGYGKARVLGVLPFADEVRDEFVEGRAERVLGGLGGLEENLIAFAHVVREGVRGLDVLHGLGLVVAALLVHLADFDDAVAPSAERAFHFVVRDLVLDRRRGRRSLVLEKGKDRPGGFGRGRAGDDLRRRFKALDATTHLRAGRRREGRVEGLDSGGEEQEDHLQSVLVEYEVKYASSD